MPLLKDLWVAANGGKNTSNTSHLTHASVVFLPRDASAERGDATVSRPSVCPSVRDV